jgi:hypothetical protein
MVRFVAVAFAVMLSLPAEARPARTPDPAIAAAEGTATACLADAVLASPGAIEKARSGKWYEAAGVMGFLCRPEVDAMIRIRDRAEGRGAGFRHFRTVYLRSLGDALAARVGPDLPRKTVTASAEPALDPAERRAAASE